MNAISVSATILNGVLASSFFFLIYKFLKRGMSVSAMQFHHKTYFVTATLAFVSRFMGFIDGALNLAEWVDDTRTQILVMSGGRITVFFSHLTVFVSLI
jgi:hypothetical protein